MSTQATAPWGLDTLKAELTARKGVVAWMIQQEHTHRRERYFMADAGAPLAVDQDRDTQSLNIQLRLFVDIGKPGRQGSVSKKLARSKPLSAQIDDAVAAARRTDREAWALPATVPASLPTVRSSDPAIAEDIESVMRGLTERIGVAVARRHPAHFNSAELFVSMHDREMWLSNGLTHRSSQSRIYAEAAYSVAESEFLTTAWSVSLQDLPVEKLFAETAENAEHSDTMSKPVTGRYAVLINAESLAMLLTAQLAQLSAASAYQGLPFARPGTSLVEGATGDLLTLRLDPSLDYGADACVISDQGIPQTPLTLVDANQVTATITDKQFADYLKTEATASRGDLVVKAGRMDYAELVRDAPQVLEILQFSALFPNGNTGTFSSEIRLAKLHDRATGRVTYLKGGSLSGSIAENFKHLRLSSHRVRRATFSSDSPTGHGYFGPEYALLGDVSIVG